MPNMVPSPPTATSLPTYLPPLTDRALRTCVTRLVPPIEPGRTRYTLAPTDAPSDALRGALERRRDRIDGWLQPAGPIEATESYKDLLASMSSGATDPESELREMRGFVEATSKLPLFALKASCAAFRDGTVGDGKWMPKPGQVCIEAGRRVAQLAKERREIEAVLGAEIKAARPDADLRARNLEDAARLTGRTLSMSAAIRSGRDVRLEDVPNEREVETPQTAQQRLDELKGQPMPPMGPLLRRSLEQAGAIRPQPPARPEQQDEVA